MLQLHHVLRGIFDGFANAVNSDSPQIWGFLMERGEGEEEISFFSFIFLFSLLHFFLLLADFPMNLLDETFLLSSNKFMMLNAPSVVFASSIMILQCVISYKVRGKSLKWSHRPIPTNSNLHYSL